MLPKRVVIIVGVVLAVVLCTAMTRAACPELCGSVEWLIGADYHEANVEDDKLGRRSPVQLQAMRLLAKTCRYGSAYDRDDGETAERQTHYGRESDVVAIDALGRAADSCGRGGGNAAWCERFFQLNTGDVGRIFFRVCASRPGIYGCRHLQAAAARSKPSR